MKIAVVGSGYVGLVAGACFAENGNEVVCIDKDAGKVKQLQRGQIPIYEPGLEEIVRRNRAEKRLTFTTNLPRGVRASEIIFIAVGTPTGEDGSADLKHVLDVARETGPRPLDGLRYLLFSNWFQYPSQLVFLQPFNPAKTPVVLIHALLSTPRMWKPVLKGLLADREIRDRYQFWFFFYPTGQPIPHFEQATPGGAHGSGARGAPRPSGDPRRDRVARDVAGRERDPRFRRRRRARGA